LRLFLASTPPPPLLKEITGYTYNLKKKLSGWELRIPPPGNIHMTYAFIGNFDPDKIADLKETIKAVSSGIEKFSLQAGPVSFFPSERKISGVWIPLEAAEAVVSLKDRLDEELLKLGIRQTHPGEYKPHITIIRVKRKGGVDEDIREYMQNYYFKYVMRCSAIELFESKLLPRGAVYRKVFSAELI